MMNCKTPGCQSVSGLLPMGLSWIRYCPVCGDCTEIPQPRTPDAADRHAAGAFSHMKTGLYAEAEAGFLSAAANTGEKARKAYYLWLSLLCRYGVSYVEEVWCETLPNKRSNLLLPALGRFPLPDTDITGSAAYMSLKELMTGNIAVQLHQRVNQLQALLKETGECLKQPKCRSDIFIAWHNRSLENSTCSDFADKLNNRLLLSKECFSFLSFRDLHNVTVDHYESRIYTALASASVLVIVADDYNALGEKFLASEIRRFMWRKQNDPTLRIHFCGMRNHIGSVPAFLLADGLQLQRENCDNSDHCAELVARDVLDILRGQREDARKKAQDDRKKEDHSQVPVGPAQTAAADELKAGLVRVKFLLRTERWQQASQKLEELLDKYPACGELYLYALLNKRQLSSPEQLIGLEAFCDDVQWEYACEYADASLKQKLDGILLETERLRREQEAAEEAERLRREQEAAEEAERLRKERERAAEEAKRSTPMRGGLSGETQRKQEADRKLFESVRNVLARNQAAQNAANTPAVVGPEKPLSKDELLDLLEYQILHYLPEKTAAAADTEQKRKEKEAANPSILIARKLHEDHVKCEITDDGVILTDASEFEGTHLNVPEGVTAIGDRAFEGNYYLESISIPDTVVSIGEYAFAECESLKSIMIPSSVTTIGGGAFEDCSDLETVILPNGLKKIYARTFIGCTALESVTIPESVTSIEPDAFDDDEPPTLRVSSCSYAELFCLNNDIPYVVY